MTQILDGRKIAKDILRENVMSQINGMGMAYTGSPVLSVVLVGNDPASEIYVNKKIEVCKEYHIETNLIKLDEKTQEQQLVNVINKLNYDPLTFGILVQLPLPLQISQDVLSAINPIKDIDCLTPENIGLVMQGRPYVTPCAVRAILEVIQRNEISTKGKHIVVLNRSFFIGQALMSLLSRDAELGNATVTMCHEYTLNLQDICKSADIIISAVGKRDKFVLDGRHVKEGGIVIDIGVSRCGKNVYGDINIDSVMGLAKMVTPPIGGIGPITISCLLSNFVIATKKQLAQATYERKKIYNKYSARAKRSKMKEDNKCSICGKDMDKRGILCSGCCGKRLVYWNNKKAKKIETGRCLCCSQKAIFSHTKCETCYLKELSKRCLNDRKHWQMLKTLFDQQNICPYSGVKLHLGINTSIDHKIPLEKGGQNEIGNLQWLYRPINTMKWNFTEAEFISLVELIHECNKTRNKSNEGY